MIALEDYKQFIPRDPKENCVKREELIRAAYHDEALQDLLMRLCKADIFFWIDLFVYQTNPRRVGHEPGPFIVYDFQREAVQETKQWLAEQEDVLWEKSRYMGATWLALLMQIHDCLFFDYKKFLDISHTANAVDASDDPDSLFWKVQFVLELLPDWMRRGAERQRTGLMKFPATKSAITGAATTERAGVGGRATWVLGDEFAKQKDAYAILGQTADTGPRLFVSTHYEIGTAWHSLTQRTDIKKKILHWSQHPEMNRGLYRYDSATNTIEILDKEYEFPADYRFVTDGTPTGGPFPGLRSPWYDKECARRANARDIAMHLDIDPKGSVSQFFDALTIHQLRGGTRDPVWQGELQHDRDSGRPMKLVRQENGSLKLWTHPKSEDRMPAAPYAIGADISGGVGSSPSCLSIIHILTGEKVGEYVNAHIKPIPFAVLAVAICRLFADEGGNGAYFAWEQQGPGVPFGQTVIDLGYRHLYFKVNGYDKSVSNKPGWYPGPEMKRVLLEDYKAALVDGSFFNPSDRALEQCLEFRYDRQGRPEHPGEVQTDDPAAGRVNHGDLVIADGLAWMLAKDRTGGRRTPETACAPPEPNTLGWFMALEEGQRRRREAEY